jgi:hypothetical protein
LWSAFVVISAADPLWGKDNPLQTPLGETDSDDAGDLADEEAEV